MTTMEAYGFPNAGAAKAALLTEMSRMGVVKLEAHYSGGNDEGGVDNIEKLIDAEGKDVEIPERGIMRPKRDADEYANREGLVWEGNPLWDAADDVLSSEFGSWAGEFSAYGVLYADRKENRVWRAGEMSSYDGDSNEY